MQQFVMYIQGNIFESAHYFYAEDLTAAAEYAEEYEENTGLVTTQVKPVIKG